MLKSKSKIILLLTVLIMLISSISFATSEVTSTLPGDNARTSEGEPVTTSEEGDIAPISEEAITQATQEIYNGDLYIFDNDVVMDRLVDGNVFIFGNNVDITGRVNGSLFVFANKVTFGENSYIVQSIYAAANEIVINGAANDLYAVASKIDMSYDSFMIRDLRVAANTFNFKGGVGRDAFIEASNFNFETTSGASAIVYGNLNYSSNKELELSKEFVQGDITYSKQVETTKTVTVGEIILDKVLSLLKTLIFTFVLFLLIVWLAPKFAEKSAEFVGLKSFMTFGVGALAAIIATLVSILLLFTNIGVPIAFALFGIFVVMMFIGFSITAICITFKFKEQLGFTNKYLSLLTLLIVTVVLWLLELIPVIGGFVSLVATLVGFGTILVYLFTRIKKDKVKE